MVIERIIASKTDLKEQVIRLLINSFSLAPHISEKLYDVALKPYIDKMVDTVWILIESPYVDKVYRDTYYAYFSTKLGNYKRDCFRLSFFMREIKNDEFQQAEKIKDLAENYLGFMIIRPTDPKIVGRSVISPKALKDNNFLCICTTVEATANSLKFRAVGFPHSSQDTEMITCAETTLWETMEYFGNKYAEYKPVLPSRIVEALKRVSSERQVPSRGLNIQQMSYALREFGFGSRVYAREEYGSSEFKRLFSTYIESGLPLIVAIENRMHGGKIGHAILAIGHENVKDVSIDSLTATEENQVMIRNIITRKNISLYDNDDLSKSFVFVDDNRPVYQLATLDNPTCHYTSSEWHNCQITYFIVPLYSKIYLEAYKAKIYFKSVLFRFFNTIPDNSEIYIRFFLISSRSFKHELSLKEHFNKTFKNIILEISMPKFIWIGEVSNRSLIKQQQADGLFIIDATEANTSSMKPLIMAAYQGVYISFNPGNNWINNNNLNLGTFSIFTCNLKGF